jgi:hypothetical protein
LNKAGREFVGSTKIVTKTLQWEHVVMKNDIYIHFDKPKLWANEIQLVNPEFTIIPDASFSVKGQQYFLEVDREQKMKANMEKLLQYKRFQDLGLWQKRNGGRFPIVLFYTNKEIRKHQLMESNPGINLQTLSKKDL